MTLSRRILILIFPVVLASYGLVAMTVYVAQRSSFIGIEQVRISQQVNSLQALMQTQLMLNHGLVHSLIKDNSVRQFIGETNEKYRINSIGSRLEENIRTLIDNPRRFLSVALFSPTSRKIEYYFENSDDPFSQISREQAELARTVMPSKDGRTWKYLDIKGVEPLIIHSEFIDPKTFSEPLPSQLQNSYLIQVAIRPFEFQALKKKLEAEYGARLEFSPVLLPANGEVSASAKIGQPMFIRLTASSAYISARLLPLRIVLGLAGLVLSFATLTLLVILLRRYITNPIEALDHQLIDIMEGRREKIIAVGNSSEINRLSGNIGLLYENLTSSLNRIQDMSWTDPLTRISNRTHFNLRGSELLLTSHVSSRHSLMFIDLDNFKFVNDRYGHEAGDLLLATFAAQLRTMVTAFCRKNALAPPLIARLSGDEFAVLLQVNSARRLDVELADRVLGFFTNGFAVTGRSYPVSASIGLATYPDNADSITQLISKADIAMYQAKSEGKNCWSCYSPELDAKTERERLIQVELRLVKPQEQFNLVFMPLVDRGGTITRAEALLRWNSPVLGQVSPAEFVPIAEGNGLFSKIDQWVIDKAMGSWRELAECFGTDFILSINISAAELHVVDIVSVLESALERHGVKASCFEIELTETFATSVTDKVRAVLFRLRDIGFRIAIDDFGAGYTSIRQIIEYPVDTIKLDLHIVHQLTTNRDNALLASMIALCHAQGMAVVAEGVDTDEKRVLLMSAGCDLFQGYLIGHPMPIGSLTALAQDNEIASGLSEINKIA